MNIRFGVDEIFFIMVISFYGHSMKGGFSCLLEKVMKARQITEWEKKTLLSIINSKGLNIYLRQQA